jgi:hypothetical protein
MTKTTPRCLFCAAVLTPDDIVSYADYGLDICEEHAEAIANYYNKARSGDWLTWEDQEPPDKMEAPP